MLSSPGHSLFISVFCSISGVEVLGSGASCGAPAVAPAALERTCFEERFVAAFLVVRLLDTRLLFFEAFEAFFPALADVTAFFLVERLVVFFRDAFITLFFAPRELVDRFEVVRLLVDFFRLLLDFLEVTRFRAFFVGMFCFSLD